MPVGVDILNELNVHPPGHAFTGIDYRLADLRLHADFREGPGLAVRRTELSRALLQACEAQDGIRLEDGVNRRPDWKPDLTVAADGLHSSLRHELGWAEKSRLPGRWGIRRHFRTPPWNGKIEIHVENGREAYVTPVAPDQIGIAVLSGTPGKHFLDNLPVALRERLGEPTSETMACGPLEQRTTKRVSREVVLLGDASGYLDACTGEGISLALAQARLLAEHYPHQLHRLEAAFTRLVLAYKITTYFSLWMHRHPKLRRPMTAWMARHPKLFQRLLSLNMGHLC